MPLSASECLWVPLSAIMCLLHQVRRHAADERHSRAIGAARSVAQAQYESAKAARRREQATIEAAGSVDDQLAADPFEREAYMPIVRLREELVHRAEQTIADMYAEGLSDWLPDWISE